MPLFRQAWRHKILAAIEKHLFQKSGDVTHRKTLILHLEDAVNAYQKLVGLTEKTYIAASDMNLSYNWREGLKRFENDLEIHKKEF